MTTTTWSKYKLDHATYVMILLLISCETFMHSKEICNL
jgi:hypothetical protein